jgi:tRNA pseudouridine55 synthase
LIGQDKSYQATVRLGQETDTYDAEGVVTAESPVVVDEETIEVALTHFRGPIVQVPPMYSAIKKDGQPLYVLARQGVEVERAARPVTIYSLEIINWHPPDLTLAVTCSSGTYLRSLAYDLGRMLGCGGHITALRRTSVGQFSIDEAVPLNELSAATCSQYLQPADSAVAHLPAFHFSQEDAGRLQSGQRLARDVDTQPDNPLFRAYNNEGQFIGIVAAEEGHWQPRKIFHSTQ